MDVSRLGTGGREEFTFVYASYRGGRDILDLTGSSAGRQRVRMSAGRMYPEIKRGIDGSVADG
jgi:hypothetical protein